MDKGGGSTNLEESLPMLFEGRVPLAAHKEKDRDAMSSSGEERGPRNIDV